MLLWVMLKYGWCRTGVNVMIIFLRSDDNKAEPPADVIWVGAVFSFPYRGIVKYIF